MTNMAYLHCHNCDWAQDDFWTWRYNPIICFWSDIKWLWRPRFFKLDNWFIEELSRYTNVPVFNFNGKVFSWNWLILEFIKNLKVFLKQRWWTYKSFVKDPNKICPKCSSKSLDID